MATLRGGQVEGTDDGDLIYGEGVGYDLEGRGGDDTIYGETWGGGSIDGGEGHDRIYGSIDDSIDGGDGNDTILGASGDIAIFGGAGDDIVEVREIWVLDSATLDGGDGYDTLVARGNSYLYVHSIAGFERLEFDGQAWLMESQVLDRSGRNLIEIEVDPTSAIDQLVIGIEGPRLDASGLLVEGFPTHAFSSVALMGSVGDDKIIGSSYRDYLGGYGGDDYLNGGLGDDALDGRAGADTLIGGAGADSISGGDDADRLIGSDGADTLNGGAGADVMTGGLGDDLYYVDEIADVVHDGGGRGTDTVSSSITYSLGANIENLTLTGTAAIDGTGNAAANVIIGSEGRNVLDGGAGADTLTGGAGRDQFAFSAALGAGNVDVITDFEAGDRIRLSASVFEGMSPGGLGAGKFVIGTEAADANDRIVYDSATGSLYFDRDGAGGADAVLFAVLEGAPTLSADDFVIV